MPNLFADLIPPDHHAFCIQFEPGRLVELIEAIDKVLNSGWQRDPDNEETLFPFVTCYRCDGRDSRAAATLVLVRLNDGFLRSDKVAPCDALDASREGGWSLTGSRRKHVLVDFHDNILSKLPPNLCLGFGIRIVPDVE